MAKERSSGFVSRIQVLAFERRTGTSKKSGAAYDMGVCQCALHEEGDKVTVGELVLPKGHAEVAPGFYVAAFRPARSIDGRIFGQLESLTPVGA